MPKAGVLRELSCPKTFGASPLAARSRSMRPVEYMPELQDDRAAVSTTKLTMPAPAGMPISAKACDEGADARPRTRSTSPRDRMTTSAPT